MDEKKVREAIYCMKSFADDTVCEECGNYDRCDHTMVADNARTAIEALEKQLPKIVDFEEDVAENMCVECPSCGSFWDIRLIVWTKIISLIIVNTAGRDLIGRNNK